MRAQLRSHVHYEIPESLDHNLLIRSSCLADREKDSDVRSFCIVRYL